MTLTLTEQAKILKKKMKARREKVYATLKEIKLLILCHSSGNYEEIHKTKLYIQHGGEYCEYLQILG